MDASKRGQLLNRLADLMERDAQYLAVSLLEELVLLDNILLLEIEHIESVYLSLQNISMSCYSNSWCTTLFVYTSNFFK